MYWKIQKAIEIFSVICCLHVVNSDNETQYPNYCPTESGCQYGIAYPIPVVDSVCYFIANVLLTMRSGCLPFYEDALIFTDRIDFYYGQATSKINVCDEAYENGAKVNDCLYPNGSVEINFCSSFFALAYNLRQNCSSTYTIDSCKIPKLGQLAIDHFVGPNDNCAPGPYLQDCQLKTCNEPSLYCSNCVVASCRA